VDFSFVGLGCELTGEAARNVENAVADHAALVESLDLDLIPTNHLPGQLVMLNLGDPCQLLLAHRPCGRIPSETGGIKSGLWTLLRCSASGSPRTYWIPVTRPLCGLPFTVRIGLARVNHPVRSGSDPPCSNRLLDGRLDYAAVAGVGADAHRLIRCDG
jgi:hypothetical protein